MKLLTRTSIYYLALSLTLFLVGGVIFYVQLRGIIDGDFTENLYEEQQQILQFVKDSAKVPTQSIFFGDQVSFSKKTGVLKQQLKDTLLFNPLEEEYQLYRRLTFPVKIREQEYAVAIHKPLFESDDLVETISYSLGLIAAITLVLLFVLTRVLSEKMWKPFYETLEVLQRFDLNQKDMLKLPDVKIWEFKKMNNEIQKMTEKIHRDYVSLKEFTENASHEIQTPLAIIRSKMELMIQSDSLLEEQMKLALEVAESTNRLSKLNQSLLLLAKIENRQFHETQPLNLNTLIEQKLIQFDEMISFKKITVDKQIDASLEIQMNAHLADILFSNVIGNAIKHNFSGGKIDIRSNKTSLVISNTGNALKMLPEKLFERFKKEGASTDSTGLGLSIVKQICDTCEFTINYLYSEGIHTISLNFKSFQNSYRILL